MMYFFRVALSVLLVAVLVASQAAQDDPYVPQRTACPKDLKVRDAKVHSISPLNSLFPCSHGL